MKSETLASRMRNQPQVGCDEIGIDGAIFADADASEVDRMMASRIVVAVLPMR